jgi:hypothetical protein
MRRVSIIVALLVSWWCFGMAVAGWLGAEHERCKAFKLLAAECYLPQQIAALAYGAVFAVATGTLAWTALRRAANLRDK